MMALFYKSAFLSCIEDRKKRSGCPGPTIATLRDHANLLIDFVDSVLNVMFDIPLQKPAYDPETIGKIHAKLAPLGFDRSIWHKLGECFAEVMFCQEVVRAYPQAASAWSLLAVAFTDKVYGASRIKSLPAQMVRLKRS
ncbi:hypothetical protein L596_012702 [Steinernema carpocapsae]|uniref:Globin family profile domain-containing protein n=1 Tax=Steinernema carpocapsae TaxID=34508 RepID=A0A4U5NYI4_STECR|nr:hypothetical protein L596_012702 [Steinernema carpocapsae]